MSVAIKPFTCDNEGGPGSVGSAHRDLTHSPDVAGKGLAMKATRKNLAERKLRSPRACIPLADRLWAKVEKMPSGCWEWRGALQPSGHGRIQEGRSGSRLLTTNRVAWMVTNGPIPDGLVVRHKCDNPPCCNPDHLELGTVQDNNRDMDERGRRGRVAAGEDSRLARLTAQQVEEIRDLIASGLPIRRIAERFEVHRLTIWRIASGATWRITEDGERRWKENPE